jgi:hypothetical protein
MAKFPFLAYLFAIAVPAISPLPASSQMQTSTITNGGTRSTFSYSIQSTYGVTTSANASANFKVDNEAILKLKSGSFVANKFGTDEDKASAVFVATPTGANVDLNGVSAKNLLLLDDGTYFRSTMKSVDNPDPTLPTQASASAQAVHSSTIVVENAQTSFSQTLTSSF